MPRKPDPAKPSPRKPPERSAAAGTGSATNHSRAATKKAARRRIASARKDVPESGQATVLAGLAAMAGDAAGSALRYALDFTGDPLGLRPLLDGPAHPGKLAREAGKVVRELRELAGLTVDELSHAMELGDSSFLEAVEAGTATLSFDLVLRLAAIVARNDPMPAILRLARTSNPAVAAFLDDWGAGRLPLQIERERQFVNLLRGNDAARELSDESFEQVLRFTRTALNSAVTLATDFEHKD